MKTCVFALVVTMAASVGSPARLTEASQPSSEGQGTLSVTAQGAPAEGVDVFAVTADGQQSMGTTGANGVLGFDPALLTGKVRVQVAVKECPDAREVYLVSRDTRDACSEAEDDSDEEDCRCDVAGAIWWGSSLGVDVVDLTASGASAPLTSNPFFWGGLGGAGAATAIAVGSGGSETATTTPPVAATSTTTTSAPPTTTSSTAVDLTGIYDLDIVGVNDPDGHRSRTGDPPDHIDIEENGGNFTADGAPPWIRCTGTIDAAGRFRCTGMGTVAGRPGTMVSFEGTIQRAAPYSLTGTYRMGTNGGLPGGRSIDFMLEGRKR